MEENEWAFCSLWSKKIEIKCATALVNPKLEGDYFFNRATVENCNVPYEQVAQVFWDAGIDCHLYFRSQPPPRLRMVDTMYVLRAAKKKAGEPRDSRRIKITAACKPSEVAIWIDVFCRSFSVPEWKDEVARIITSNAKKLELLRAYNNENNMPAGCGALFTTKNNSMTGLYCLGTVPAQRSKGVAKSILNFARALAEKQGTLLFLQTLGSENLLGLYKSSGFETAYTKTICAVPRIT
ncbi:Acetyltransferase (GNAT) domain [Candidatus Nitrososphaera evergladensis SR1]|jgi:GNAT superfamily N-acetyltransferase|uniref:Acetyltransferase (GNAT) domain n=2 Tax=Nitrososphaera TaxID=497726 RepID=A0A075MSC7_9ARCH|nr:Acetyltransferase (GNAT) domain [Candidatus Nitrososphaera evergladensis SR1]